MTQLFFGPPPPFSQFGTSGEVLVNAHAAGQERGWTPLISTALLKGTIQMAEPLVICRFLRQPLKGVLVESAAWWTPSEIVEKVRQDNGLFSSRIKLREKGAIVQSVCLTRIPSDVKRVAGVASGRPCVGTLRPALLAIHHELHPVTEFAGSDCVPTTVAETITLRCILCCHPAGPVVNMEEQLEGVRVKAL